MTESTQSILQQALALSQQERCLLVKALIASLPVDSQVNELWVQASRDRLTTDKTGELAAVKINPLLSLLEEFDQFAAGMPADELARLPTDGAEQHDHYLYGTTKRES